MNIRHSAIHPPSSFNPHPPGLFLHPLAPHPPRRFTDLEIHLLQDDAIGASAWEGGGMMGEVGRRRRRRRSGGG